jgi:lactate permease
MDAAISIAPIVILIYLMTKRNSMASHVALPLVALLVYGSKLIYFESDPNLVNATVVEGLLSAWTPILIIGGAILMFKTMEATGSMDVIRSWLDGVSNNRVAQLMIIGWAFTFLIEGASGFGTPAALAAPILVGIGFNPLRVAILCLIMNSVPVSFGAVGTPTWFGLGHLPLTDEQILAISRNSAITHAVASTFIPLIALLFVLGWREVRANLLYIYLAIAGAIVPYVIVAHFSYEFPALVGGMVGLILAIVLARFGVGLSSTDDRAAQRPDALAINKRMLAKATFPLWGTVLILVLTRVPQVGLKALLTDPTPILTLPLGTLAEFKISAAFILILEQIYGTSRQWVFQALYVPAIIPFVVVTVSTLLLFRVHWHDARRLFSDTCHRMVQPGIALFGALVLVNLMMADEKKSMVMEIGNFLAATSGPYWQNMAAYLGALGSFFSGSATISNLTFGGIQYSIAEQLDLDKTVLLSLQSVGGAMGNMVCINNIVAVCSILGISQREGFIIKRTALPMILYGVAAAIIGQLLIRLM